MRTRVYGAFICLALLLASLAVYAPLSGSDFVNYDDPEFVRDNPHVRAGLTRESLVWALTSTESANWFPVTRLSYLLDAQIGGVRAARFHFTNVFLHALAAMALFGFLQLATGARWLSAWVAALFAVHPLHVESVAWVSERKDVLCALFWFLALWNYGRYTRRPSASRYGLILIAFVLGLMSKPMIVTLPVILVILDYWPLQRRSSWRERAPFFGLSAIACIVTYLVQRKSGAVGGVVLYPLTLRVENALVSYVAYVSKFFWPTGLAVFYPYPREIPVVLAGGALLVLAGFTVLAARLSRACPYLAAGGMWFLMTLLPVIGLVQVGAQARADRYMYVPMVGLELMLVWGMANFLGSVRWRPVAAASLAGAMCVAYAVSARAQVRHWQNSESLFSHALRVTNENYVAHNNLGTAISLVPGRLPEAIGHYQAALRIWPEYAEAHNNLGSAWALTPGRLPEAIAEFEAALRANPGLADAHFNLATALAGIPGRQSEAIAEYRTALDLRPDYAAAHINLGALLMRMPGRLPEAISEFQAAPESAESHNNLGSAFALIPGRLPDAITEFRAAIAMDPSYARAHYNLANVLAQNPATAPEAIAEYQAAVRAVPSYAEAHYNLAVTLAEAGRVPEAIAEYEATLRLQPDSARAHYNLALVLLKMDSRSREALAHLEAAQRTSPNPAVQRVIEKLQLR
jgi:tetratricopeptide (TPR) repeat protein